MVVMHGSMTGKSGARHVLPIQGRKRKMSKNNGVTAMAETAKAIGNAERGKIVLLDVLFRVAFARDLSHMHMAQIEDAISVELFNRNMNGQTEDILDLTAYLMCIAADCNDEPSLNITYLMASGLAGYITDDVQRAKDAGVPLPAFVEEALGIF